MAEEIVTLGGCAENWVDVYDATSVQQHADDIVRKGGRIDIAFNAVMYDDVQGPLQVKIY